MATRFGWIALTWTIWSSGFIRRRNWEIDQTDGITEYCVIAALSKAAYGNHDTSFRMSDAYWLLESRIGDDNGDLVNWNNTLGRTQAEVVSLLRTVAAEQG